MTMIGGSYYDPRHPAAQLARQQTKERHAQQQAANAGSGNGGHGGGGYGGGGNGPPSPGLPMGSGNAINGNPLFNLQGASTNYVSQPQPAGQNIMTSYYIKEYNAIRGDLYFNDFSGGMDAQIRQLSDGVFSNELALSYLDAKHSRTLILSPYVGSDTTNDFGTLEAVSACYLNDGGTPRWLAAGGDTQNNCLYALTTSITSQTANPTSNIISLTTVKIVTNTERVIIGRAGAAAWVGSNFAGSPTLTAMHSNTSACWGVIRSPLNSASPGAETLLMYCGGSGATLYSLSSVTSAVTDAPTAVLTNWPSGGYALGIATLGIDGGVARAYWVHPLNSSSASMLDTGLPGRIVSTNLEGTDPKIVETGLPFIKHAMLWRGGIVVTDGRRVHFIGDEVINLGWNKERRWERSINGSRGFGVAQCIAVLGERLLISSATITADTQDVAAPTFWEEYRPEDNTWQFVTNNDPLHNSLLLSVSSSVLPNVNLFTGQTPVYTPFDTGVDSGLFYWHTKAGDNAGNFTYKWQSIPLIPSGVNPNYQQSESAWISYSYDNDHDYATNYAITPEYHYLGLPMVVSDIHFSGTLKGEDAVARIALGVPSSSGVSLPNVTEVVNDRWPMAKFVEDTDWRRHWWINPYPENSIADRLQFMIILMRGLSGSHVAKATPNGLPFRVGFYVFLDGVYKDPKVMEPKRFWGPRE